MSEGALAEAPARRHVSAAALQRRCLWALMASGCIAFIEPSPYEVAFLVTLLVFAATGLRVSRESTPLIAMLLLFNIGGALSLAPYLDERLSVTFVAISFYFAVTTVFFAWIMLDDTTSRLEALERGVVFAAIVASASAMIGFFDIAGLGGVLTRYDGSRATGMFKDPNVLGPFLVLPSLLLIQRLLAGTARRPLWNLALIGFIGVGELLSFSRGAWGDYVAGIVLLGALGLLTARTPGARQRIVLIGLAAAAMIVVLLLAALSVPKVRTMLQERASFSQSYDVGETGRFGLQKRSIPLLLVEPNGFGPLRFRTVMGADPHNVYVNAFASYGWLGGISYLALIAATVVLGWRMVFQRTPWQAFAIPIWAALFPQILQGLQIDTDHWRHFWLLTGLVWGLSAANARWLRANHGAAHRPVQAAAPRSARTIS